jgi:ribose transport system permease protein
MSTSAQVATPSPVSFGNTTGRFAIRALRTYGIVGVLLLLVIVVSSSSDRFLTTTNGVNLLTQWAPAGVIAVGMTFVILTGGFDLSVASGYGLCAVTAAGLGQSYSPAIAFTAAILVGLTVGIVNGVLVAGVGVNPFITTVGTGFIVSGISLVVTGNKPFVVNYPGFSSFGDGKLLGLPYVGIVLIAALSLGALILSRTLYGQWIYSIGGNLEASRLAGIRVRLVLGSSYALTGLCVGIAGVMTASQLSTAQADLNPSIVFDVLTIVVVGGTSLKGGFGSMWRTAVGIALLATIANGLNLLNISPYAQDIVKGTIIVGALALDRVGQHLSTLVKEQPA